MRLERLEQRRLLSAASSHGPYLITAAGLPPEPTAQHSVAAAIGPQINPVNPSKTTIKLKYSPKQDYVGQTITFTATVTSSVGTTPVGTAQFTVDGTAYGTP